MTTTVRTVADELREAAARLRGTEHHGGITGDSDNPELLSLIVALLNAREPLAAWLNDTATWWDNTTAYGPEGDELYHATPECGHEAATCGCFHRARDRARAINGASS